MSGRRTRRPWAALLVLLGCGAPAPLVDAPVPRGLDAFVATPEDNPLTSEGAELGRRLFFDRILSLDGSITCASCHRPERAFSDTTALSRGVAGRLGRRNAPTLLNRGYATSLFWDGRVATLEEQVLHPIEDSLEMALPLDRLLERLRRDRGYRMQFRRAFGAEPSQTAVARALASYLRVLRSADAPIDRWRAGDTTALSAAAQQGLALFLGRAGCATCHGGPTFTDEEFHNTGVAWRRGFAADSGRYAVTRRARDLGAFKTPTLREVSCTAPYMHDGSIATLEEVIAFYDRGGHPNPRLDSDIGPLRLSVAEQTSLVAFLRALGARCRADERSVQRGRDGRPH